MIKILPTAKFPLSLSKGSNSQRIELAKTMNAGFFHEIASKFKEKSITPDTFQKTLDEFMPVPHSVKVKTINQRGGSCELMAKGDTAFGYNITLESDFNDEISLTTADVFMHETYHYFSNMAQPKLLSRKIEIFDKGLMNISTYVYKNILYIKNGATKEELSTGVAEFLKNFKMPDRVSILQLWRYNLMEEINAYKEGTNYQHLIQKIHSDKICEEVPAIESESFDFEMKLGVINEKLRETLAEYRNMLKNKSLC